MNGSNPQNVNPSNPPQLRTTTSGRTAEQQGVRPEEVCSRAGLEHPDSSTTTAGFSDTCQELPDPFAPSTKSRAKGERK